MSPACGLLDNGALQTLEHHDLIDLGQYRLAIWSIHDCDLLTGTDAPARHAPDADAADEAGIVERADLQLQWRVGIVFAHRHVFENGVEQRPQVIAPLVVFQRRPALQRGGKDHREIELRFGGAEFVEQIEGLVDHPLRARTGPVDLVDHDDRLESQRQCLAGDEAGLGHRPFDRVDQQQHAVHHRQHALDFTAEIGVTRGVDDVDVGALILHGTVLGEDGDAALAFQVVRIHHPLGDVLMGGEGPRLAQKLVHQRGLAVIHVGDDGDVANVAAHVMRCPRKTVAQCNTDIVAIH